MAPEIHEGKYSFKADIYSLGITIIEMITNEKPYNECKCTFNIYDKIKNGIFPNSLLKIDNENICNFIKLCLKKENERPSADELLKNKWLNDFESKENFESIKIKNINFRKLKSDNINDVDIQIETLNNNDSQSPNFNTFTERKNLFFNQIRKSCTNNLNDSSNVIHSKNTSVNISIKESDLNKENNLKDSIEIQFIIGKKEWKNKSKIYYLIFHFFRKNYLSLSF
jgi:serine/threonine protein kinase